MNELEQFARHFLMGRINWQAIPRSPTAVTNFGNIISLVLYRKDQFQVELFIVPHDQSHFTEHRHPDVDVIEFGLTGDSALLINGIPAYSEDDINKWLINEKQTARIHIAPTDYHSGQGYTPYAFLSIQHWLHGISPSSVGLNWQGAPASSEQAELWTDEQRLTSYG